MSDVAGIHGAATFETAYATYYGDVYRYVAVLVATRDEADDVVADTFERACRSWRSTTPDRPLPWLLLTARRLITDRWRRARILARRALPITHGTARESETEFWLWIGALARALTPRQREVLVLRYVRDLTDEEIGSLLGVSASGVRSLVSRALAALRQHPEVLS